MRSKRLIVLLLLLPLILHESGIVLLQHFLVQTLVTYVLETFSEFAAFLINLGLQCQLHLFSLDSLLS